MDFNVCVRCGVEIESKGIHFRGKVFCSDECCEEFEAEAADKSEPVIAELVDEDLELDDNELGYRDGDGDGDGDDGDGDGDDPLDDDFDIKPDDF